MKRKAAKAAKGAGVSKDKRRPAGRSLTRLFREYDRFTKGHDRWMKMRENRLGRLAELKGKSG